MVQQGLWCGQWLNTRGGCGLWCTGLSALLCHQHTCGASHPTQQTTTHPHCCVCCASAHNPHHPPPLLLLLLLLLVGQWQAWCVSTSKTRIARLQHLVLAGCCQAMHWPSTNTPNITHHTTSGALVLVWPQPNNACTLCVAWQCGGCV